MPCGWTGWGRDSLCVLGGTLSTGWGDREGPAVWKSGGSGRGHSEWPEVRTSLRRRGHHAGDKSGVRVAVDTNGVGAKSPRDTCLQPGRTIQILL